VAHENGDVEHEHAALENVADQRLRAQDPIP